MKLKRWAAALICLCILTTSVSFAFAGSRIGTDWPRDISGQKWTLIHFKKLDENTPIEGRNRVLIVYTGDEDGDIDFYGSKLKDDKYPLVSQGALGGGGPNKATDNYGNAIITRWIRDYNYQNAWFLEYDSTTSDGIHRYKIALSDGTTYLRDNTGSLPTSGGDLTVTTDKSKATVWEMRLEGKNDNKYFTFGHDISSKDPHFVVNHVGAGKYSLDLSRDSTDHFDVYVEMPWITTQFCYEDGDVYKQDCRQIYGFNAPGAPEKQGYTFAGWTTTRGSTKVECLADTIYYPLESKTYHPVYIANPYTVRFYRDSTMTGSYMEQHFTYDQEQILLANPYSSTTADFQGWQNAADTSQKYNEGAKVKNLTTEENGIVNLYGVWEEHSYTVVYSASYGTGSVQPVTVKYSQSIQLPDSTAFQMDGYKLVGWNTKPDGSGAGFAAGGTASALTTGNGETVTLYAIWEVDHTHTRGNFITVKTPSCSEDGIRQEICPACGIVIGEELLPHHAHTPGEWETTHPATCTVDGEKVRKCTDCGVVTEVERLDALGHKEGEYSVIHEAASCNGMGERAWYCQRCGNLVRTEAVSPEGHTPGITVTKFLPTCNTEGIRTTSCQNCGIVLAEEKIPAHGHTGGGLFTLKSPTCTADGIRQQACTTCGAIIAEERIPAHGHSGQVWVTNVEPTCLQPGEKVLNCAACGVAIEVQEVAPLGHTVENHATCSEGAICSVCGIPVDNADGSSHTWTSWKAYKAATFFTDGQERRFCTLCGDEEFRSIENSATGREYIPAIGIGAVVLAAAVGTAIYLTTKKKKNKVG